MQEYFLDGNLFVDKESSYIYMDNIFAFPKYQGHNLDALWDSLNDINDLNVVIVNARSIVKNLGEYGLLLLDVFGDLDNGNGSIVTLKW